MAKKPARVWWKAPKAEAAKLLSATTDELLDLDTERQDRYEKYYQLYGGQRLVGIRPWERPEIGRLRAAERVQRDKLRLNVVKAAIDTITSKVGKLQPRPTFLTNGGDWALQLKAKKLQKFADGAYHQSDAYQLAPEVFRDAMIFGTGLFYVYAEAHRICAERVPPWEVVVDPRDALYGKPRCMYRVKWVSRESVAEVWGDGVLDKITLASVTDQDASEDAQDGRDGYVRVVEAWRLPEPGYREASEEREDEGEGLPGRHLLIVGSNYVASDDDYCCHEFPFVPVHWSKPVQGYWGDSAVAEVVGIQVEVNRLIQHVQKAMRLVGGPWTFLKDGATLKPGPITNEIGKVHIIEAAVPLEQALKVVTFNPVPPQVMEHIWALYAKAFEILGSNQLAASATAPAGLESGRALERLSEEHSERFMTVSRHFEYCVGEALARQFIRVAKEIDAELKEDGEGGFVIRAPGGKTTLDIAWEDVCIDEDAYLIQVFPTSVLPTTPSGRIDEVERLSQNGWLSGGVAEARRLINLPDLEQSTNLATADEDNLQRQLSDMVDEGKSVLPEPYQNLDRALLLAQQTILRAQADGVPEDNITKVRQFLTACEQMLRAAKQPQMDQGQPQGGPPPQGAPPQGAPPPGA